MLKVHIRIIAFLRYQNIIGSVIWARKPPRIDERVRKPPRIDKIIIVIANKDIFGLND